MARVWLRCPDNVSLEVERFYDQLLIYKDADLARWFGLFVAELAVDNWLRSPGFIFVRWILPGPSILFGAPR